MEPPIFKMPVGNLDKTIKMILDEGNRYQSFESSRENLRSTNQTDLKTRNKFESKAHLFTTSRNNNMSLDQPPLNNSSHKLTTYGSLMQSKEMMNTNSKDFNKTP